MLQRRLDTTKWIWWLLVLSSGPARSPVNSVAVRTSEKIPATVEAQAKFFQDFFSVQLSPYKIEFGHVCEDPNTWEQRYEKKDFKNHRDMGKVRWGDRHGGYGEHYWDLNHAAHAGNHGNDDYHEDDTYDENSQDNYPKTDDNDKYKSGHSEGYSSNEAPPYDESERTKRAYSKMRAQSRMDERNYEEEQMPTQRQNWKNIKEYYNNQHHGSVDNMNINNQKYRHDEYENKTPFLRGKSHAALLYDHKIKHDPITPYKQKYFEPYNSRTEVRQLDNYKPIPGSRSRLFMEPSTGYIIDRVSGQAYVLQPVRFNKKYS